MSGRAENEGEVNGAAACAYRRSDDNLGVNFVRSAIM